MDKDNFIVRESKKEDMQQVLNLIKELAEFEKMGKEVKIGVEVLEKDGFELDQPLFKCYVVENLENNAIIGYALFYHTYSTWLGKALFLEDICIQQNYRNKGIGKKLFLAVAKYAYENCSRLDFEVLSWNPAMEFYKKLGAVNLTALETWQRMRLDKNSLEKLIK